MSKKKVPDPAELDVVPVWLSYGWRCPFCYAENNTDKSIQPGEKLTCGDCSVNVSAGRISSKQQGCQEV